MKKHPTLAASVISEKSVCILTFCAVYMFLLCVVRYRTVPYAVFLIMSCNPKDYRAVTVTRGDRETELPRDLLDINNIRHYAASIF